MARLLKRCMEYYNEGNIKPISPIKTFEAVQVEEAFRYMQKGVHIGKIVVMMPQNPDDLKVALRPRQFSMRADASYLLIGGLGGLGRSVAVWMAENGATNILFLSRSANTFNLDDPFFRELGVLGCAVQLFGG